MKIVCDACQAKYSIADDKVRGKVFKIRCKKCSHVIVVRGTEGEMPATGDDAVPAAAEPSWHVVVDGEQVGPLTDADIRGRLSRSEISGDTFIWKEGMADWVKLSALSEFTGPGALDSSDVFAPVGTGTGMPAIADEPAAAADQPDDPFAAPTRVAETGDQDSLFAAPAAAPPEPLAAPSASERLFGGPENVPAAASSSPAASPFAAPSEPAPSFGGGGLSFGGGGGAVSAPSAGAGPASSLTGQRHENSVLFSLSNLEALAKPSAPASQQTAPARAPVQEGSGLIDIRAMAATTLGSASPKPGSSSSLPDLPAFAAPQFSPVAPVLLPSTHTGSSKGLLVALVVIGVAVVGVLAVVLLRLSAAPPPVVTVPQPAPVAAPPAAAPPPTTAPVAAAEPPVTPPPAAGDLPPREGTKPEGTEKTAAHAKTGRDSGKKVPGTPSKAESKPAAAAEEKPAREEKPTAAKKDSLDDLLAGALGNKKPAARPKDDEPAAPSKKEESLAPLGRDDIVKGMKGVQTQSRNCFQQFKVPGTAMLKLTVAKSGKVTDANVTGKFGGTPTGNCVVDAARSAKFPASAGLTFDYPIPLH